MSIWKLIAAVLVGQILAVVICAVTKPHVIRAAWRLRTYRRRWKESREPRCSKCGHAKSQHFVLLSQGATQDRCHECDREHGFYRAPQCPFTLA